MKTNISKEGCVDESKVIRNMQLYHNTMGIEKVDSSNCEDAINECTKLLNQNPNDAYAYFNRATLKVRIGDIDGARRDFKLCENCHRINNSKAEDFPLV